MKIQDLEKLAKHQNLDTELTWVDGQKHIGIKQKYVWHWFRVLEESTGRLYFVQSYSTNTGKIKKGILHGYSIIDRFESLIEKHLK